MLYFLMLRYLHLNLWQTSLVKKRSILAQIKDIPFILEEPLVRGSARYSKFKP